MIFGTAAWLVARVTPESAIDAGVRWLQRLHDSGSRGMMLLGFAVLAGLLLLVSGFAFQHRPLSVDSVAQLFQARIFASGSMVAPSPPLVEFFVTPHMIIGGERWYSQYPPGHPALLAMGVLLGVPWLVPILLSLLTAGLLYGFTARAYDRVTAKVAFLLLLLAPFFWFMGARMMNHISSLAGIALFLYGLARSEEENGVRWAGVAGLGLGIAFLSRPLEALAVGAVSAAFLITDAHRNGRWRSLGVMAGGFLAAASLYLAFNAATTGDPLRPGYIELWGESHGLGFHTTPWGDRHTPMTGLRNELVDLALLELYLFEWPIPSLFPLGFALILGWLIRRWDGWLLAMFLAVPAVYLFYWHRDASMGPRFLYTCVAFLVPLTARALVEGARRLTRQQTRFLGGVNAAVFAVSLLLLSTLYALAYGIPARFRIYQTGMDSMKLDLVEEAEKEGIERGLVLVSVSWGDRLISRLRGLGTSASTAEKAYRQIDHCVLEGIARQAAVDAWTLDRLESGLESAMVGEARLVHVEVNGDPSLRLQPGSRLTPACLDELEYDQGGYTIYTPHLASNDPELTGPLVFARDLRGRNAELIRRLERPAWLYRGGRFLPIEVGR